MVRLNFMLLLLSTSLGSSKLPQPTNAHENEVYHSFLTDYGQGQNNLLLGATESHNFRDRYFQWSNWGVANNVKDAKYLTMNRNDGTWTSSGDDDELNIVCVRHLISTFEYKPISPIPDIFYDVGVTDMANLGNTCSKLDGFEVLSIDDIQ